MKEGRIELILNGVGPAREGALHTILGPLGAEMRNRINRVTDVTTGYRPGKVPNRRGRMIDHTLNGGDHEVGK